MRRPLVSSEPANVQAVEKMHIKFSTWHPPNSCEVKMAKEE